MRSDKYSRIFAAVLPAIFLVACGDASGPSTPTAEQNSGAGDIQTARFIDSPTGGISYECGTQTGVTRSDGSFDFEPGSTCTFSIGGLVLGNTSVPTDGIVTPYELADAPRTDAGNRKAVAIAQLLQSVGVVTGEALQVGETAHVALAGTQASIARNDGKLVTQSELAGLVNLATGGGHALVSPSDASDNLGGYLERAGIDKESGHHPSSNATRFMFVPRLSGVDVYRVKNYVVELTSSIDVGRSDSTPLGVVVAQERGLAFVFENHADLTHGLVHALRIDPDTGAFTNLGKTTETLQWILAAQYDPYRKAIYSIALNDSAINTDKRWIVRNNINVDGDLAAGEVVFDRNNYPTLGGFELQDFSIDPFGRNIYATNWTGGYPPFTDILPIAIGSDGALSLDVSAKSRVDGVIQGVGGGFGTPNGRYLINIVDSASGSLTPFVLFRHVLDSEGKLVAAGSAAATGTRPCSSLVSSNDGRYIYYSVSGRATATRVAFIDNTQEPLALVSKVLGGPVSGGVSSEWCAMAKAPGDDYFVALVGNMVQVFKIGADGIPEFKSGIAAKQQLDGQFLRLSSPIGYF